MFSLTLFTSGSYSNNSNILKIILILSGIFCVIIGFGQPYKRAGNAADLIQFKRDSVILFSTDQDHSLKGVHFGIKGKILTAGFDTTTDNLILFLNLKNGKEFNEVISYNPESEAIRWKYPTYGQKFQIMENNLALINPQIGMHEERVIFLDKKTGEVKYFIENADIFPDAKTGLLFSFPKYTSSKQVEIIREKSGLILGTVPLPSNYYLSSFVVKDSCFYLNANGIHVLDKNFKEVWKADIQTIHLDVGAMVISVGFSITLAAFSPYAPVFASINYFTNLTSDFHFYQNNLIVSDRDRIYSFDRRTGECTWQQKLPYKTGFAFMHDANDSVLSFFNSGICTENGRLQLYGKPYHALVNKNNGHLITYQKYMDTDYIADLQYDSDSVIVLFNNRICRVKDDDTLTYVSSMIFHESIGEGFSMTAENINETYVLDSGGGWHSLLSLKSSANDNIFATSMGVMLVDRNFRLLKNIPSDSIGKLILDNDTFQYFEIPGTIKEGQEKTGDFIRHNKSNGTNCTFNIDHPYFIDNNKFYVILKNGFQVYKFE